MGSKISEEKAAAMTQLQESFIRIRNHEISEEYIEKLISSMPSRCKAVIKLVRTFLSIKIFDLHVLRLPGICYKFIYLKFIVDNNNYLNKLYIFTFT